MKKIRLYLILFWTLFLIPSCVEPLDPGTLPVDIEGEYGIDFSVFCTTPGTKVEKPGVDDYNENLLSTVDWFIFTSDADASVLYAHGRVSPDQTMENPESLKTDDIKIKQLLSMDNYVLAKGKTGYVYVIANLPDDSVTITETTTLADLRGIALTADFGKLTNSKFTKQDNFVMTGGASFDFNVARHLTKKAELSRIAAKITLKLNIAPAIDEEKQLATGVMEYQKTWYPVLAPTTINGDNGLQKTFNGVQVYLSFANNKSDMKGTLKEYNQDDFFTYNRYAFIPTYNYVEITPGEGGNDTYVYGPNPSSTVPSLPEGWADNKKLNWSLTGSPFYTYPMEWESDSPQAPFIKVIVEWTPFQETGTFVRDNDGKLIRASRNYANAGPNGNTKEFYYKIPLPDAADCKLLPNDWYELTFDVSILGSTSDELPMELRGQYCVVDWSDPHVDAGGNLVEGSYLSTESDTYYIYGGNSITIPVRSSHNISTEVLGVAFTDYSSMNPTNYTYPVTNNRVGLNNKPFTITSPDRRAYANDGSGNQNTRRDEFTFTHNLVSDVNDATTTADNPPDVSKYTFHVKITNQAGNEKTIKIIQEPPLMIKNDTNTSGDSNKGNVHINMYSDNNNRHYYFYSAFEDFFGSYYFNQQITYNGTRDYIYNLFYRRSTIEGVTYVSDYADTYGRPTNYLYHSLWLGGVNGRQTSGDNSNQNMYIITSSVAPTGTMIADVRSSSVNNITGTTAASWSSPQGIVVGTTNSQRQLSYYYPTSNSEIAKTQISPKFRVASSYGMQSGGISYEAAQRRCASYQEDGIPAGRWRIPTRAEIEYMIKLSSIEVIPSLFQPADYTVSVSSGSGPGSTTITYSPNYYEGGYWTADGGVIYPWRNSGDNPSIGYLTASELLTHSNLGTNNSGYAPLNNWVRCVYDEWYWGETTSSQRTNKSTFYWGDKEM